VALVPSASGLSGNGGLLPLSGFPGGFSPTFTNLAPATIRDAPSDPIVAGGYDTVVLVQIDSIQDWLSNATFMSRIDDFVFNGGKLIIWDSECQQNNYSSFVFSHLGGDLSFTVDTPGPMGSADGQIRIVENNTLSTNDTASVSYVNTAAISGGWDIGDANAMVTSSPNWCTDMVVRNVHGTVGPVQTYARYGNGLVIWNGLDMDYMSYYDSVIANDNNGGHNLHYIWYLQLKQQWNPDNLPCGIHTAGITVTPVQSTNPTGTMHTVTATIRDNLANPIVNITVNFTIYSGPNAGLKNTNVTNANGEAYFSWTSASAGTDKINATAQCPFKPVIIFDDKATKTWIQLLTPGKVTGGGQIAIIGTGKASFGFNVMYQEGDPAPKGELQYIDHTTKMTVHGPNMTSLVVSSDKTKATFTGECEINGVSGFKFKVYVEDNGEPGKNDVFKIALSNGYSAGDKLLNGNIQIHKQP
jgi:hypothetical protein